MLAVTLLLACALQAWQAAAADHGVAIMYHRFGENRIPSTNIRLEQLDAHIAELKSGRYTVLPLAELLAGMRGGTLPDRAVAITVDDAYASFAREGWPRFRAAGLPVTLFVAVEPVERGTRGYMTWDEVRQVAQEGVTIGHHSWSHLYYPSLDEAALRADLARATERFQAELGAKPALFAYPYGAWSAAARRAVAEHGFTFAFGQHSGVMHAGHDMLTLPRFPFNESFGTVERLRLALDALPLRLEQVEPADPVLGRAEMPVLRFALSGEIPARIGQMNCFSTQRGVQTTIRRLDERRFEVTQNAPFTPDYGRLSCTVPEAGNRFRWYGLQYFVKR